MGDNNVFISSNYQLLTDYDSRLKNDSNTFGVREKNEDGNTPLKIENDKCKNRI